MIRFSGVFSVLAMFSLFYLSSCTARYSSLTETLISDFSLEDKELKKVQFYVSEDVILRRSASKGSKTISGGVLRTYKGRQVEEIRIKAGTPGVFLYRKGEKQLAVSFEEGQDDRYLMFGPNPDYSNRYVLLAGDWKDGVGQLSYDGRAYEVDASRAFLMVDLRQRGDTESKARNAGGRRIN